MRDVELVIHGLITNSGSLGQGKTLEKEVKNSKVKGSRGIEEQYKELGTNYDTPQSIYEHGDNPYSDSSRY